ncbi:MULTISPECIES: hypothetical protein [Pseudomonas]|uniref:Uncharacterized protein n=1 Tax=Pseudomonas simiae TaxID=321846 RepID=A0ABS9GEI1_9PSED|nr:MULTISPECIES: hypothetical protein [Pseudomonas]MCF5189985.1 hypothetical protein [Pseudomonas simiae]MCF5290155.1 hypothetical protein [Pseudomonas simiae]MCF5321823.1 hypothetical protein [Pseudomonas simiae]MCF5338446.1 hypothetical protein [Pseudomonas simiae]MCF5344106.1 hypothetical protein [Pseudomonas simiae]
MNLEFSKKFVLVSLGSAAIWGGLTFILLQTGFLQLAGANATQLNITFGSIGVTSGLLILVIFSFLSDNTFSKAFKKGVMSFISFFTVIGFSAFAACLVYYSNDGWNSFFTFLTCAGLAFWISSLILLYIISNVTFSKTHRWIVCVVAAIALAFVCYCVLSARSVELL